MERNGRGCRDSSSSSAVMELWSNGVMHLFDRSATRSSLLHYSITSLLHHPITPSLDENLPSAATRVPITRKICLRHALGEIKKPAHAFDQVERQVRHI